MDPLTPIDRVYVHIPVTAALSDGSPVTLTTVDVALLPYRTVPSSSTPWTTLPVTNGEVVPLVAGSDADPTGAIVLPTGGGTAWIRETDNPEVKAVPAGFISVR